MRRTYNSWCFCACLLTGATKGAVDMLTKVMALELGPYQVLSLSTRHQSCLSLCFMVLFVAWNSVFFSYFLSSLFGFLVPFSRSASFSLPLSPVHSFYPLLYLTKLSSLLLHWFFLMFLLVIFVSLLLPHWFFFFLLKKISFGSSILGFTKP